MLRTLLLEILVLGQHGLAGIAAAGSPDPYALCNTNSSSHLLEQPRRGCLGMPSGCVASSDCKTLVTWAQDPITKDVNFSMLATGVSGSTGGYAAIGLNTKSVFQLFVHVLKSVFSHSRGFRLLAPLACLSFRGPGTPRSHTHPLVPLPHLCLGQIFITSAALESDESFKK